MPLYENRKDCENRIALSSVNRKTLVFGPEKVLRALLEKAAECCAATGRQVAMAFDGWYGVDWEAVADGVAEYWALKKQAGERILENTAE